MLALCLSFWMLPLVAAPNWVQWQAEIARLHRERLPDDIVRERLQSLQARLPPDPPYVVQKELAQVRIRLADDHAQARAEREALRRLAVQNDDLDTARLMQIGEIFDSHSDANIETSLDALGRLRLDMDRASPEVHDALAMAYAYMYWDVGNFELALRNLLQARDLARALPEPNPALVAERSEIVARLYVDMHDPKRALEVLERMGQHVPVSASPTFRAHLTATRAAAYRLSGRADEAIELLVPALGHMPVGDAANASQRIRQELVRAYLQSGQPERAHEVATSMLKASAAGSPYYTAEGEVLQGAADAVLGRIDTGIATMDKGLGYFKQTAQVVALLQGLDLKVDVLADAGRDHEALAALREQHALLLRLYDSNRAQGIASLQVEDDIARREREIRDLSIANGLQEAKLDKERLRNVALMISSLLAIGMAVLLGLLLHATRQQRKALWKDALTGAYNRHYLPHWLQDQRQHPGRRRVVALLDIDHFKAINDRHGHAAGDEVLHQTGLRLRAVLDRHGELFRWGGEEFLLVQDLPDGADVDAWLQTLLRAFDAPIMHADLALHVGASIGSTRVPSNDEVDIDGFQRIVRLADAGMYQAKAQGRGRAVWLWLTAAGKAAWPWRLAITPDALQAWEAKGWVEVRTLVPPRVEPDSAEFGQPVAGAQVVGEA